jgi:hypothetical protein
LFAVIASRRRQHALAGGIGRGAGRRYRRHAVRARAHLRTRSASQRRAPQKVQRIATRSVQRSALRRKNAHPCSARPRGASRLARFGSIALSTVSSDADFTEGPNIDSSHPAPPAVAGGGASSTGACSARFDCGAPAADSAARTCAIRQEPSARRSRLAVAEKRARAAPAISTRCIQNFFTRPSFYHVPVVPFCR